MDDTIADEDYEELARAGGGGLLSYACMIAGYSPPIYPVFRQWLDEAEGDENTELMPAKAKDIYRQMKAEVTRERDGVGIYEYKIDTPKHIHIKASVLKEVCDLLNIALPVRYLEEEQKAETRLWRYNNDDVFRINHDISYGKDVDERKLHAPFDRLAWLSYIVMGNYTKDIIQKLNGESLEDAASRAERGIKGGVESDRVIEPVCLTIDGHIGRLYRLAYLAIRKNDGLSILNPEESDRTKWEIEPVSFFRWCHKEGIELREQLLEMIGIAPHETISQALDFSDLENLETVSLAEFLILVYFDSILMLLANERTASGLDKWLWELRDGGDDTPPYAFNASLLSQGDVELLIKPYRTLIQQIDSGLFPCIPRNPARNPKWGMIYDIPFQEGLKKWHELGGKLEGRMLEFFNKISKNAQNSNTQQPSGMLRNVKVEDVQGGADQERNWVRGDSASIVDTALALHKLPIPTLEERITQKRLLDTRDASFSDDVLITYQRLKDWKPWEDIPDDQYREHLKAAVGESNIAYRSLVLFCQHYGYETPQDVTKAIEIKDVAYKDFVRKRFHEPDWGLAQACHEVLYFQPDFLRRNTPDFYHLGFEAEALICFLQHRTMTRSDAHHPQCRTHEMMELFREAYYAIKEGTLVALDKNDADGGTLYKVKPLVFLRWCEKNERTRATKLLEFIGESVSQEISGRDQRKQQTVERNTAIINAAPEAYNHLKAKAKNGYKSINKKNVAQQLASMPVAQGATTETIERIIRKDHYLPKKVFA